jgi:hypothetical protein
MMTMSAKSHSKNLSKIHNEIIISTKNIHKKMHNNKNQSLDSSLSAAEKKAKQEKQFCQQPFKLIITPRRYLTGAK